MSFDWSEYLRLAQELVGQPTPPAGQETRQRSALSRAYYAAFCQARNYLRDQEGLTLPVGGHVHAYVRDHFRNSSDSGQNRIGHALNRLRIDRNKADYDDSVTGLDTMTTGAIIVAQQVLGLLRMLQGRTVPPIERNL
jgi:uncharacterized protein (UPF0332 family)